MSLNGETVSLTWEVGLGNAALGGVVVVGDGPELTYMTLISADIGGDEITFELVSSGVGGTGFVGLVFRDSANVLPDLGGITILSNSLGYDVSRTVVSADLVGIDLHQMSVPNQTAGMTFRLEFTPSDMALSSQRIRENVAGGVIGDLTVDDINDADTHTFAIDDARFKVVDGQLRLKNGVTLDFETEASIELTVTATDSFGLEYEELFTVTVTDAIDRIRGDNGNERVRGTAGDDRIYARAGDDKLWGLDGDDILRSVEGNDRFWGGAGADTFVYSTGSGTDRIMDFEPGIDRIDLRKWAAMEDFADLKSHAKNRDGDLWIADGKDVLIIEDFSRRQLHEADVLI